MPRLTKQQTLVRDELQAHHRLAQQKFHESENAY